MKATLLFLFTILSLSANAQRPIIDDSPESKMTPAERQIHNLKIRQYKLNILRIDVKTPSGFSETPIRSLKSPFPGSSSEYTFTNPDSTVLIVIALLPKDSATFQKELAISQLSSNLNLVKHFIDGKEGYHSQGDPNFPWLNHPTSLRAPVEQPHLYTSDELKRFNAEWGIIYKLKRSDLHLGRYKSVRNISLHKKYRGDIEIEYFVKVGAVVDLEPVIAAAADMISYK